MLLVQYMLSTVDYSFWKQFPGPIVYDIIVLESLIPVTLYDSRMKCLVMGRF